MVAAFSIDRSAMLIGRACERCSGKRRRAWRGSRTNAANDDLRRLQQRSFLIDSALKDIDYFPVMASESSASKQIADGGAAAVLPVQGRPPLRAEPPIAGGQPEHRGYPKGNHAMVRIVDDERTVLEALT